MLPHRTVIASILLCQASTALVHPQPRSLHRSERARPLVVLDSSITEISANNLKMTDAIKARRPRGNAGPSPRHRSVAVSRNAPGRSTRQKADGTRHFFRNPTLFSASRRRRGHEPDQPRQRRPQVPMLTGRGASERRRRQPRRQRGRHTRRGCRGAPRTRSARPSASPVAAARTCGRLRCAVRQSAARAPAVCVVRQSAARRDAAPRGGPREGRGRLR